MHISEVSVHRPITTMMFYIAVVLIGFVSLTRLAVDLLPDLSYPQLTIWTKYSNVPPQEVESRVTRPIETTLRTIKSIKQIRSISQEGLSLVRVDFQWGTNMDFTALMVREQLDKAYYNSFPEASRPIIIRIDPSNQPIMSLSVSGENLVETKNFAESIAKRRLEQLDCVALAIVTGGPDREIHVDVNSERLLAYGLSVGGIASALNMANYNQPGGWVKQRELRYSLRTLGMFTSVDQINDVVIGRVNDNIIQVKDVATVKDEFREQDNITRYNGQESIGLIIQKESGSNTVKVSGLVKEVIKQLEAEYPRIKISVAYDQAKFISSSITNVLWSLLLGGFLAFLVLFLFLHDPRNPINISLSIPISVLATFSLLYFMGISLNIMSLGGLALGVGMLVDNSIVVLENIFRHRQQGKGIIESAIDASKEISLAVSASTFTTVAVFFPIIFVEGVTGQLFRDQSLTITFSLMCSLVISLTLLPMLASHFFQFKKQQLEPLPPFTPSFLTGTREEKRAEKPRVPFSELSFWKKIVYIVLYPFKALFYYFFYRYIGYYFLWKIVINLMLWKVIANWILWKFIIRWIIAPIYFLILNLIKYWMYLFSKVFSFFTKPIYNQFDKGYAKTIAWYERFMNWALDNRALTLFVAFIIGSAFLLLGLRLDRELMPPVDQRQFEIEALLPVGSTLAQTDEISQQLSIWLLEIKDVESIFSSVGIVQERGIQSEKTASLNRGLLMVKLKDPGTVPTSEVIEIIRKKESLISQASLNFTSGEKTLSQILGTGESDIVINVEGNDYKKTLPLVDILLLKLQNIRGLSDIHSSYEQGNPEIRITVKRDQVDRYGLQVGTVSSYVAGIMGGQNATQFADFDKKVDVIVRPNEQYRNEFSDLLNSYYSLGSVRIPVKQLIDYEFTSGPSEIRRENQVRQIQVFANIYNRNYKDIIADISKIIKEIQPPEKEYKIEIGGEREEMQKSFRSLMLALIVSILLVYMILAAQFEALLQPFVILFTVPLSLVGVVIALYVMGFSINVMSGIGMIILVGIVVNNAIVLIDFINRLRRSGVPPRQAIIEAGKIRFRPIWMTTITTVLALTPVSFGWIGEETGLQAPLAITVIGGLTASTALTLLIIPIIYSYFERLKVER